jgi:hypothetical protein
MGRRLLQRARRMISHVDNEVLAGRTDQARHQLLAMLRRALVPAPAQPLWSSAEGDARSPPREGERLPKLGLRGGGTSGTHR